MNEFGGKWTTEKLSLIRQYLIAYAKIMNKQHFNFAYIDAFAGCGYFRKIDNQSRSIFMPEFGFEEKQFIDGSAKIALEVTPTFQQYIFIEKELTLNEFPSPQELWQRYKNQKQITEENELIVTQEYFYDSSGRKPRYYQRVAVNRIIDAVTKKQDRILLVMATGTGKTYTAFQTIWCLWKSKTKKRIVAKVDTLLQLCDGLEGKLSKSQQRASRLMNAVVQREINLRNSNLIGKEVTEHLHIPINKLMQLLNMF